MCKKMESKSFGQTRMSTGLEKKTMAKPQGL
jgi:hypothetical protein